MVTVTSLPLQRHKNWIVHTYRYRDLKIGLVTSLPLLIGVFPSLPLLYRYQTHWLLTIVTKNLWLYFGNLFQEAEFFGQNSWEILKIVINTGTYWRVCMSTQLKKNWERIFGDYTFIFARYCYNLPQTTCNIYIITISSAQFWSRPVPSVRKLYIYTY